MSNESSPSKSARERELFLAAIERPAGERRAFLDQACGGDRELRRRLEALLEEHETPGDFLVNPAMARQSTLDSGPYDGSSATTVVQPVSEKPGEFIGRYKLLQKIGEGGCGVVYMAEQEKPVRRRVALKIIKLGMDTKSVIARFEAERQALAMMDHPNIARVLDAGATDTGRPYFVMELVRGIKITEYADQNHLPTQERLKLFIQVCQAIQHAHQKGIIHRDIKPSNILVTLHDGVPVPKVIDFGIAKAIEQKLTEKTLFTLFQSFIGTPAYMSPEQAQMSGLDIDTRSDIYSLGVLMYAILTGKTPFDPEQLISKGIDECRKTILEAEPARPSQMLSTMLEGELTTMASHRRTEAAKLVHQMRGDLDWIVMKCLEKDRTRRYETAAALATDVQRYLNNEPIAARPPSTTYRLRKFIYKHRVPVAAAASVALALTLGSVISIGLAIRATEAEERARLTAKNEIELREQAEREKAAARLNEYVADINLAQQSLKDDNLARAVQLLRKHVPEEGETDLRGFEWRYLFEASRGDAHIDLLDLDRPVQALAFSPDGQYLAFNVDDQESVQVLSLLDRRIVATLAPSPVLPGGRFEGPRRFALPDVESIAFVDNGRMLASATRSVVRLWDTKNWEELNVLEGASEFVAASHDGRLLAAVLHGERGWENAGTAIWNVQDWRRMTTLPDARGPMAFSHDNRRLAANSSEGLRIWPVDGDGVPVLLQNSTNLFQVAQGALSDRLISFSPDGSLLLAPLDNVSDKGVFVIGLWDAWTGEEVGTLPSSPEQIEHTGVISSLELSDDGRTLATASLDHSIRLWDLQEREHVETLSGHLNEIWSLALSPDGQTLASGDKDGRIKLWKTKRPQPKTPFPGIAMPLGFSPSGATLAALDRDQSVVLLSMATGETLNRFPLQRSRGPFGDQFALSDELNVLAQGDREGKVTLWNIDTGYSNVLKAADRRIDLLALSPDGRHLVTGAHDQMPRWWDLRAGTNMLWDVEAHTIEFSTDNRFVATLQSGGPAQLWSVQDHQVVSVLETNETTSFNFRASAKFSPDSSRLAAALADHTVGLWDVESGDLIGKFDGHKQPVFALAFAPDNRTLATAGADSTVRIWNLATRTEMLIDRRLGGQLTALEFSPDGHLLVGGGFGTREEGLRLYHAPEATTSVSDGIQ